MKRLKRGVALYATEKNESYLVGTQKRAIRINTPEEKSAISLLATGIKDESLSEFIETLPAERQLTVEAMVRALEESQLCEIRQGVLALSKRYTSAVDGRATKNSRPERDAAYLQLQNRIAPELSQTNWISDSIDGGIETISARQDLFIEISGKNRVATLLYSLLIASGVTQTRMTPSARALNPLIGDLDIAIGAFTSSDIGNSFDKECEILRREIALLPFDKESSRLNEFTTPDLRVHCGDLDPEDLSLWMSSGQPFFHIPAPQGDYAQIGPCVLPGKSPCLRCVELTLRDQYGISEQKLLFEESTKEYPVIAAYFVASLVASQILNFFEDRSREITGRVISLDYQNLAEPRTVKVTRHPLCGCAF